MQIHSSCIGVAGLCGFQLIYCVCQYIYTYAFFAYLLDFILFPDALELDYFFNCYRSGLTVQEFAFKKASFHWPTLIAMFEVGSFICH